MGHLPGDKFHVGSRFPPRNGTAFPRTRASERSQRFTSRSRADGADGDATNQTIGGAASIANFRFDNDGNPVQRDDAMTQRSHRSQTNLLNVSNGASVGGSPVFQIPVQFVPANDASAASLQIPVHPSLLNGPRTGLSGSRSVHDLDRQTDRLTIHGDGDEDDGNDEENKTARSASRVSRRSKKRSKSVPKNRTLTPIEDREAWRDSGLDGAGGGWFTEGQALRNIRRHREAVGLPPRTVTGRTADRTAGNATERETEGEVQMAAAPRSSATPAVGYTGHLTEMHRLQIGKNFTDAAKESRKLQQSYRESLNGSFVSTRSHSPGGASRRERNRGAQTGRSTRRSQASQGSRRSQRSQN
ncbi:hypothetical protein M3Y99_00920800 [Aphelenchoides fujianensis]|nr:hypothetical protein M3Y99_00920800 [Aphelenchoides fujianensis]